MAGLSSDVPWLASQSLTWFLRVACRSQDHGHSSPPPWSVLPKGLSEGLVSPLDHPMCSAELCGLLPCVALFWALRGSQCMKMRSLLGTIPGLRRAILGVTLGSTCHLVLLPPLGLRYAICPMSRSGWMLLEDPALRICPVHSGGVPYPTSPWSPA